MAPIFDHTFWWETEEELHTVIHKYVKVLREEQADFYNDLNTFLGLYGGRPISNIEQSFSYNSGRPRLTFNIVHSLCQAATSKIAKHRPGISFLTTGGDWSQRRRAKDLDKFIQGQIYATKAYEVAQQAFLDACIMGTGIIKAFIQDGKIHLERTPLMEMTLDTAESGAAQPRQLFQTKVVSRHVLANQFPEHRDAILSQEKDEDDNADSDDGGRFTDMVTCHESWHLPSGKGASDGRHVISIANATLLDESYSHDYFPFVFIRWTNSPVSFWGNGLAREVKGIQVEINKLLAQIQQQMHLATPKVFIEEGSKIVQAHLNNKIWGAIRYRGTPPQFFVPRSVSGEMFQHLDRLINQAYEMTGISQLSAQSKKPVGLDSGRALREFSDIESERFMVVGQSYEASFVEISRQIIDLVKKAGKKFTSISFSEDSGVEHIIWGDVKLEEDQYVMRIQPVGSLPQTPAAKLASITEMHMNGMFTKEEAMQLLDFPDLEQANKMANSHIDLLDKIIDDIIDEGKYASPEPFMNLALGLKRFQMAYNLAKREGAPEDRLALLRQWINQAAEMMGIINQPPPGMEQAALPSGLPPLGPEGMPPEGMVPPAATPPGGELPPTGLPPGITPELPPGLPPGAPPGPPMGP
ncbi:MAG: hypothetical protein CL398_07320 [Acidiferrobacteraceae bacterium]|nr:hypothetical protein [Acidiferrobacteraceae bacterium]